MIGERPEKWDNCGNYDRQRRCPCCGPDATAWIRQEIALHWGYMSASGVLPSTWEGILPDPFKVNRFGLPGWTEEGIKLAAYGLVVDYGYIDYHRMAEESWALSPEVPYWHYSGPYSCTDSRARQIISVCGTCHDSTDFGNFILGVALQAAREDRLLATAAGGIFNTVTCLQEKSLQECINDIPTILSGADTRGVERGYDFAVQNPQIVASRDFGGINRHTFCEALRAMGTDWHDKSKITPQCSLNPCSSEKGDPNLDYATNSRPDWNTYVSHTVYGVIGREWLAPIYELQDRFRRALN
jgi:hypothetical protein